METIRTSKCKDCTFYTPAEIREDKYEFKIVEYPYCKKLDAYMLKTPSFCAWGEREPTEEPAENDSEYNDEEVVEPKESADN